MSEIITQLPILSIMTLFLGAFVIALVGRSDEKLRDIILMIAAGIPLILMLILVKPVFFEHQVITSWLGGWEPVSGWAIGIGVEVDALSLFFGLMVAVMVFVVAVYSMTYMNRDDALQQYYTLFLMLSGSVMGLVLSGDLFNIFVMVEIMTMTAVALTAFRTDYPGALEGAMKYLVVGSMGSTCILTGIALLYSQLHTLNLAQIAAELPKGHNTVTAVAFAFLFLGFATKTYLFPFHPPEADAPTVAPASISVMVSSVLTKCGVYGIIRLCYTIFRYMDKTSLQYLICVLGALSCFICVTMAFNQHDFKRLLAFHSISQVGYVVCAIGLGNALGLSAGLYHALNHTLFKGLLFLTAGAVYYATGSLDLDRLGGLSKKMPKTCALFLIGAASISGLPPFNGFASKWMIYQAAFERAAATSNFFFVVICVICLLSSVLTLASFVKVSQSVFFGQLSAEFERTKEVPAAMQIPMWILAVLCIVTGVFPQAMQKVLLAPASADAMNSFNYIGVMMGTSKAAASGVTAPPAFSAPIIGLWNPVAWIILLLIVTCAVCLVSLTADPEKKAAKAVIGPARDHQPAIALMDAKEAKYESFFSGEESVYSQVGGSDLFWGFKHNLRHYFKTMGDWHSGVVNDYTLYGLAAMSIVIAFTLLFIH